MGAGSGGYETGEPITLCNVLNGLRQQRVKKLNLSYESHLGETVEIEVRREKSNVGCAGSADTGAQVVNVTNIIHEPTEPPHSNS